MFPGLEDAGLEDPSRGDFWLDDGHPFQWLSFAGRGALVPVGRNLLFVVLLLTLLSGCSKRDFGIPRIELEVPSP